MTNEKAGSPRFFAKLLYKASRPPSNREYRHVVNGSKRGRPSVSRKRRPATIDPWFSFGQAGLVA